jgi:hypothetical protein
MVAQLDKKFISLSLSKTYTRLLSYLFYEGRPLTTRGRWINPLVFFLYKLQTYLPCSNLDKQPVFILGTGRSGTTILGITLAIHREVGFLNEPKALWAFLYDGEDLIGSYNELTARYRLDESFVNQNMIQGAHRIYCNYLRFSLSSRVVDKYPELIFRTGLVSKIFPDARYLFLFRNGYDTCRSISDWSKRLGEEKSGELHDWWGRNDRKWNYLCEQIVASDEALAPAINKIQKYKNHTHRAAVEWIVTMKEGLRLANEKPEIVFGVRYEDYVSNEAIRQDVLQFCDLQPDSKYNEYCNSVLKPPEKKPVFSLPPEIDYEFIRVMRQLGYEA